MGSNPLQGAMIIKTEYGDFEIVRKDVVAITIVKIKRPVTHHRKRFATNELTHIEHRKQPKSFVLVQGNCGGWATPLQTYDLKGNKIDLK